MTFNKYLVVGGAHNWGKGDTKEEALKNAHDNAHQQREEYELDIYLHDPTKVKEYWVDGMGKVCWEWTDEMLGDNETQEMERKLYSVGCHLGRYKRKKRSLTKID